MHRFGVIFSLNFHTFPIWRWTRVRNPRFLQATSTMNVRQPLPHWPSRVHTNRHCSTSIMEEEHTQNIKQWILGFCSMLSIFSSLFSIESGGYARNLCVCFILQQYFISSSSVFIGLLSLSFRYGVFHCVRQSVEILSSWYLCAWITIFSLWFGRQRAPPRRSLFPSCRGSLLLLLLIFIWARIRKKSS